MKCVYCNKEIYKEDLKYYTVVRYGRKLVKHCTHKNCFISYINDTKRKGKSD